MNNILKAFTLITTSENLDGISQTTILKFATNIMINNVYTKETLIIFEMVLSKRVFLADL